jgi:hypothetical protein
MTHIDVWREFLSDFYIGGALPVTFEVLDDSTVRITLHADDLGDTGYSEFYHDEPLPPFVYSQQQMISKAQEWARYMYIHELREQTYYKDERVDVPDEHHSV